MLAARTASSDRNLASEQQLRDLKAGARASVVGALEESLAMGLEALDVGTALLLGRCCRQLGEAEAVLLRAGRGLVSEAEVLVDAEGRGIVPLPREFARLEGYRWACAAPRGRGSVFRVDHFGARGECVLCPDFCAVRPPATGPFLEEALAGGGAAGGSSPGRRRPASWLRSGLRALAAQVRDLPKVPLNGVLAAAENIPSVVLVVPVATVAFQEPPDPRELGRKAARRHPLHVDTVEMGARLLLSFVPLANTPSGDLDKADAEHLERELGAQLFAIADVRGRLCVRRHGGQALDLARISGATLDDVCKYLVQGWYNTLAAAPSTWHRLFVSVKRCDELEASLGPCPGKGSFMALERAEEPPRACGYCGQAPVVGCEVFEVDPGSKEGLCAACAAFVRGSPVFQQKLALSQCIAGKPDKMVGTMDESLDDALLHDGSTETTNLIPDHPSLDLWASSSGFGSSFLSAAQEGWPDAVVPRGATVLAASGLLSLRAPEDGWDFEAAQTGVKLAHEVCLATGADRQGVFVTCMEPEVGSSALVLGFVLLHPAILEGTVSQDPDLASSGSSFRLHGEKASDPRVPLKMYRRLVMHLLEMVEEPHGTPSARMRLGASAKALSTAGPLLRPNDPQTPAFPCALVISRPPEGMEAPASEALARSTSYTLDDTLARLKDIIPKAQERLREDGKVHTKLEDMFRKQESFGAIAALQRTVSEEVVSSIDNPGRATLAIRAFRPSLEELSLRLRELTAVRKAERCHQLLKRWGREGPSGLGAEGDGTPAALAVLGRDEASFRGQSALDLALAASDRACVEALLQHVPKVRLAGGDDGAGAQDQAEADEESKAGIMNEGTDANKEEQNEEKAEEEEQQEEGIQVEESAPLPPPSPELLEPLNAPNPVTGYTPLFAAAMTPGDHAMHWAEHLVQRAADINAKASGSPPLAAAVQRGELALARTLLGLRADVNAHVADGRPLLQVSIDKEDQNMIHVLMADPFCDLDVADARGRTPLVAALRLRKLPRAVHLATTLIEASCNVDARDHAGASPILHAATVHNKELCDLMLERRADKDARDPADGSHILHLVVQTGNAPLMQGLLDRSSNVNVPHPRDGRTVLHLAAGLRRTALVRQLLELRAGVNVQSSVGDTPLRVAVQAGDAEAAELLCEAAADANLANRSGCAPIHAAVSSGDVALVELLAKHKADPHLADARRWRPIHYGASAGTGGTVEWLLQNGASPDAKSYHGRTPRQLGRSDAAKVMAKFREGREQVPARQASLRPRVASSVAEDSRQSAVATSGLEEPSRGSATLPPLHSLGTARSVAAGTPRRSSRRSAASSGHVEAGGRLPAHQQLLR